MAKYSILCNLHLRSTVNRKYDGSSVTNMKTALSFTFFLFLFAALADGSSFSGQNITRTRSQSCDGFRCQNGNCIPENKQCDGHVDCTDESDETNACQKVQCPSYLFRCTYGACIIRDLECDGKQDCKDNSDETSLKCDNKPVNRSERTVVSSKTEGSCVLPEHPRNGKWSILALGNYSNHQAGMEVPPGTILTVNCANKNFMLNDANSPYCNAGKWSAGLGKCVEICDPVFSTPLMEVTCTYNGFIINCSTPIEGTQAKYKCKTFYEYKQQDPYRLCKDGIWNNPKPNCVPTCGVKPAQAQIPIVHGSNVDVTVNYPWQVALYEQKSSSKFLICGGSLISPRVIITAAHCITKDTLLKDKNLYEVAVGKYYRPYNDSRDVEHAEYNTLQSMHIPPEYKANIRNYEGDIAILVTKTPFTLSEKVQPVCMDWGLNHEMQFTSNQIKGFVTGWGFTTETSNTSDVLKEVPVTNVDYETCDQNLPTYWAKYLTSDKLCAGYINKGVSVCSGDSGGGLVFKNSGDGRYYLNGILSITLLADREQGRFCNSQHYGLYTRVATYITKFIVTIEQTYRA